MITNSLKANYGTKMANKVENTNDN